MNYAEEIKVYHLFQRWIHVSVMLATSSTIEKYCRTHKKIPSSTDAFFEFSSRVPKDIGFFPQIDQSNTVIYMVASYILELVENEIK